MSPTPNLLNTQVLQVLLVLMPRNLIRPTLILGMLPRSTVRLGQRVPSVLTRSPNSSHAPIHGLSLTAPHGTRRKLLPLSLENKCGSPAHRGSTLHRCSKGEDWTDLRSEWKLPLLCKVPLGIPGCPTAQHSLTSSSCGCCTVWHSLQPSLGLAKHAAPTKGTACWLPTSAQN